jgi:dethiobiotin synthetase
MTGYFVTGTDTGVGKTTVTQALSRCVRTLGKKVFAFKPIETGCELVGDRRVGMDMDALWKAAGSWQTGELRGVYQFLSPVAPRVAAREESVEIDLGRIERVYREGVAQSDVSLVEGAGGWRVPVTATTDTSHLARLTGLPVLVVCRATLGTINHSLLTIEAVQRDGCRVAALVLSRRPEESIEFARSNRDQILERWKGTVLIYEGSDAVFRPLF